MQKSICTPKTLQPPFLITTLTNNPDPTETLNKSSQNAWSTESRPQRTALGCPSLHQSHPPAVFGIPPDGRFPAIMGFCS
jgi:hypothetical protein